MLRIVRYGFLVGYNILTTTHTLTHTSHTIIVHNTLLSIWVYTTSAVYLPYLPYNTHKIQLNLYEFWRYYSFRSVRLLQFHKSYVLLGRSVVKLLWKSWLCLCTENHNGSREESFLLYSTLFFFVFKLSIYHIKVEVYHFNCLNRPEEITFAQRKISQQKIFRSIFESQRENMCVCCYTYIDIAYMCGAEQGVVEWGGRVIWLFSNHLFSVFLCCWAMWHQHGIIC